MYCYTTLCLSLVMNQKPFSKRSITFLYLSEIVEGLYFHCSLLVCVSVCLSVCLCLSDSLLVNKIPAERMHRIGRGFHRTVAYCIDSYPIEFDNLGLKVKVAVTQYPFFLHVNSLLISQLQISALLCPNQTEIWYAAQKCL